jgi:hypothetical protein
MTNPTPTMMDLPTAIDVIESCAGFTDDSTPVGEAWCRILSCLRHIEPPMDDEIAPILLWRRMRSAYLLSRCDELEELGYAAELRAIAKWVEECTVSTTAFGPNDMPVVWRVAGLLLAEADRAEAGE